MPSRLEDQAAETYRYDVSSSRGRRALNTGWRSPLTHPVWWTALAILLVNDLALKRSNVAGVLTGKLSDFAGLIVAPVLVSAIVRPKTVAGRLACFASVAAPFTAINVSAKAASLLVWVASLCGLTWRIWSDWTDLAALGVLPLAWRISQRTGIGDGHSSVGLAVHRAGAVLGALACVATSYDPNGIDTAAYLVNLSQRDVEVFVFRTKAPLDCAAVAAARHAMPEPDDLVFDRCWTLAAVESAPLDADWRHVSPYQESPDAGTASPRACDVVVIRVPGMADTAVFWDHAAKVRHDSTASINRHDPHALHLERFRDSLVVERTPLLDVWPVDWPLPPVTDVCRPAPQ